MCNVFILNIETGYIYIIGTFTLGVQFSKKIAEYEIPFFVWRGKYIDTVAPFTLLLEPSLVVVLHKYTTHISVELVRASDSALIDYRLNGF